MEPSSTAIWVAVIAAVSALSGVVSPLVLVLLTGYIRRKEKAQDYERQDAVAKVLMERQDRAAAAVAKVASTLEVNTKTAAETSEATQTQLKAIHTLVNSNMTTEMKNNLDTTRRELVLLNHVVDLDRAAGREPSVETLAEIKSTEDKIVELQSAVADRLEKTQQIEATKE